MVSADLVGIHGGFNASHPAPYPLELAERLVRMYSFVGDTVLDPFLGTGTTTLAAAIGDVTVSASRSMHSTSIWRTADCTTKQHIFLLR